ncbi:uncharacterized protein TRIADDRAFT_56077 [Trichoplax adhaerens]|uniref:G-protein coupled receptors family 1 profile domain-containing protein n=1 Tax=Trichoplax adhaerens TaxID=10228 RepID=B3RTX3_TRIAD|nr:hypothetical protein TRIADDRAFT_56077 [Trichoplax adhaerens]EDV25702.1 hypothetical protein TRIADDRAFT_56077 [Trichoplax adhaerens]|eukprot:XP_002111735.1 hypothetical protein TRIADDRAFT_56077 [Trichoplax adhaerens]
MSSNHIRLSNETNHQLVSLLGLRLIVGIPSVIIFIGGLIGNISTVFTIIRYRRTTTKDLMFYLVANLAMYDILVMLFALPITVIRKLAFTWPFGAFLCYTINGFPPFSGIGSVVTMISIVIDRYYVVLHAANPNPKEKQKGLILLALFIIALAIASPAFIFSKYDDSQSTPYCDMVFSTDPAIQIMWRRIYVTLVSVLILFLPVTFEVVLYVKILLVLRQRLKSPTARFNYAYVKAHKNTIKLMLLMTILYATTHTPLFTCYLVYRYGGVAPENVLVFQLVYIIAHLCFYCKSVINPIIYTGFIPEHKQWLLCIINFKFIRPRLSSTSILKFRKNKCTIAPVSAS